MSTSKNESLDDIMPWIGLGTWQAPPGVVGDAVKTAIRAGYRLIDCAAAYWNEPEIGITINELITNNEITRKELFIVSKVFNTHHVWNGEDRPKEALMQTLKDLQLDYVDLYLMHWPLAFADKELPDGPIRDENGTPNPKLDIHIEYIETWKSMEKLQKDGYCKYIGVSNFTIEQIETLIKEHNLLKPSVLQIELHPYLQQQEIRKYCKEYNITVMAYSPLGSKDSYSGSSYPIDIGTTLLNNPIIQNIATKHEKTSAQVLIRWCIQECNVHCIPKSSSTERIRQNLNNLNWQLTNDDLHQIRQLNRDFRYCIGYIPGHYNCTNAPW